MIVLKIPLESMEFVLYVQDKQNTMPNLSYAYANLDIAMLMEFVSLDVVLIKFY